ncbi:MAG: DUF4215 domain-containing protein [Myxococcota bacterium]
MRGRCLLVLFLWGCLEADSSRCGDLLCPARAVCSETHGICVRPEQLEACEGQPDGTPCSFLDEPDGVCTRGGCFSLDCGNRVVEGDEVCDDGNIADGDGCSADCRSNEECGNGVIDARIGEMCDDGNNEDGDECQSNCALPRCGDGIMDGEEVCDDGNSEPGDGCNPQCTSDESCGNNVIDIVRGELCDDGNTEVGDGCGATCQLEVCGNMILDPGEICDDGNNIAGDDCGPACRSDETCGNGIVDVDLEEQCDDGNERSRDRCSSRCSAEVPLYSEIELRDRPPRRGAIVYDGANDRLVRFGGEGPLGERFDGTFVFDGGRWIEIQTRSPGSRLDHALTYDAARRVVVLFGGRSNGSTGMGPPPRVLSETWELRGARWERGPMGPALEMMAFAYDAAREETVVFGGRSPTTLSTETWVYDGTWTRREPAASPPARERAVMSYDSIRQRVVLVGGERDGAPQNDTWEWDGATWTEVVGAGVPAGRGSAAFDATRGVMVTFGGTSEASSGLSEFDGTRWTERDASTIPARLGAAVAFAPGLGVVLHAGSAGRMGPIFGDTWIITDALEMRSGPLEPAFRLDPAVAFDSLRERVLLTGGAPMGEPETALWSFDGESWKELSLEAGQDEVAGIMGLAFDAIRGVTVGVRSEGALLETWEFVGRRWRQVESAARPPARRAPVLRYDRRRGVTVLYGGEAEGVALGDTWEFDGTNWTETTPVVSPPARANPMNAYDDARGVLLIFGGVSGGAVRDDTWEYDGTSWRERSTEDAPSPREGQSMDYIPFLDRVVLFGGAPTTGLNDTWTFDGMNWRRLFAARSPLPRSGSRAVANPGRTSLLLLSGLPPSANWEFRYSSDVPDERCASPRDVDGDERVGCEDPDCDGRACGPGRVCQEAACVCRRDREVACEDGGDDDCDGMVDCADPDCVADPYCTAEIDCANGVDDDGDDALDCADPGCAGTGTCEAFEESCGDGIDNDGDGDSDCADPDCFLVACGRPT